MLQMHLQMLWPLSTVAWLFLHYRPGIAAVVALIMAKLRQEANNLMSILH